MTAPNAARTLVAVPPPPDLDAADIELRATDPEITPEVEEETRNAVWAFLLGFASNWWGARRADYDEIVHGAIWRESPTSIAVYLDHVRRGERHADIPLLHFAELAYAWVLGLPLTLVFNLLTFIVQGKGRVVLAIVLVLAAWKTA